MNFELAAEVAKAPAFDWLPVDKLQPHPRNPRVGRPDRLDAIIESMRADGYRHEKPMLVRPLLDEGGYQIIGGHSRHAAAQAVGLEKVLCVIEPMDDESAILRIAQDNINDPLPWYSICLYVFQNAVKDSKTGLSRTRLVMAATGKEAGTAAMDGKRRGDAGEVIDSLLKESNDIVRLLDPDKNRTYHLVEIHQAPRDHWPLLAGLLAELDWSVKDTKAAVERVMNLLAAKPDWLGINDTNLLRRTAIEPGFAKALTTTFGVVKTCHDKLPESATGYHRVVTDEIKLINGREHRRIVWIERD